MGSDVGAGAGATVGAAVTAGATGAGAGTAVCAIAAAANRLLKMRIVDLTMLSLLVKLIKIKRE